MKESNSILNATLERRGLIFKLPNKRFVYLKANWANDKTFEVNKHNLGCL